jgi:poly [ADP-ribose] polymerase
MDLEAEDDDEVVPVPKPTTKAVPDDNDDGSVPASKLDDRVFDLVEMIFSKKMMANAVASMNYDVKKNPLGKLSKKTIQKGYRVLNDIGDILKSAPGGSSKSPKVMDLTNQFYTYIPHNVGKARLPFIDNTTILKEKIELLDTLNEIDVALKKQAEADAVHTGPKMHPVDRQYETLNIDITPLEKTHPMWAVIEKFVASRRRLLFCLLT